MLENFIHILYWLFFSYFAASIIYLFVLALGGRLFYKNLNSYTSDIQKYRKVAILVPAYKEDEIILSTANNLLALNYPKDSFNVFIIADSFRAETIAELRQLPLQVIEVSFDKSTKTKALNVAFSTIREPFDVALICDADNMLAPDFLQKLNSAFENGNKAIQGRRVAKNLDSSFAILDACSEAINNNIFRKGNNGLGLSSAVIGSGMAFDYERVKQILLSINAVGGFDKILQLEVVGDGTSIRYLDDALVFDEKVSSAQAFQQQRKRWLSSQFVYFKQFFLPAIKKLFKGNFSYFNLAIPCNLVLPRAFLLALLPLFAIISFFVVRQWGIWSSGLFLLYMITLAIALPRKLVNKQFVSALLSAPKAVLLMVLAVFHIRKANKTFIHTIHTKKEITNVQFQDKIR
ncbi:glycosyltransferase family 2 protein [Terrimonas sp. NA20]|uniref:Glycosyltransferase family 2 protein n=1 Tax=Terrimonas ginsenosidimutans TaxID=2908004 RepID=A0ABS9KX98_9BACT|nr:glycosyltransferase family 2 protein [Terrimonas ginsenosidimutans]MCG2616854.1 glycosyltransferase family 2 protein [Terrimonas ginsenosidimutans]